MVDANSEAFARSLFQRVALNRAILGNKYWILPVDDKGHENFVPPGRGVKSSDFCGRPVSLVVCKNVEGHKGVIVKGIDCTGKVVVRHKHLWCHSPNCPICFIRGWALRGAKAITARLAEGERRGLGTPEHLTVSPKPADRDLPESVLRKKCRKALLDRGVEGGSMLFHGYRINRVRGVLEWSPHYHCLCPVPARDKCRDCKKTGFRGCGGFVDRNYRCGEVDGYLVKVHDKRKTVLGTSFYLMHHATIRVGIRRFHIVTYFGSMSNRHFRSVVPPCEDVCPACDEEMARSSYVGKRRIVKDIGSPDYAALFVDDEFDESGEPNYVEVGGGIE